MTVTASEQLTDTRAHILRLLFWIHVAVSASPANRASWIRICFPLSERVGVSAKRHGGWLWREWWEGRLWMGSIRKAGRAQDRWTDFLMPHSDAQPNRWQLAATSCKVTVNATLNKMSLLFLTHLAKHFKIQQWVYLGTPEAVWHRGGAGYLPQMRVPHGALSPATTGGSSLRGGRVPLLFYLFYRRMWWWRLDEGEKKTNA